MGDVVSLRQSHEIVAKLQTKVDWSAIPIEVGQAIAEDPDIGREFTKYLLNRGRVQVVHTGGIIPPEGGKIIILTVPVNESRPWKDAVKAAGPNTGHDWDIWKMGEQYPPVAGAVPRLEQIFLANFGKYTQSDENLIWAKEQHLVPVSPRGVLAIGKHCPYLNIAMDPMAVVSLQKCSFGGELNAAGVWFGGSERWAGRSWFDDEWSVSCWFALVRESE